MATLERSSSKRRTTKQFLLSKKKTSKKTGKRLRSGFGGFGKGGAGRRILGDAEDPISAIVRLAKRLAAQYPDQTVSVFLSRFREGTENYALAKRLARDSIRRGNETLADFARRIETNAERGLTGLVRRAYQFRALKLARAKKKKKPPVDVPPDEDPWKTDPGPSRT